MKKRGFIGTIVLVIVAIILLKVWFGFDLFKWLNQPAIKDFLVKIWDIVKMIWENYLEAAAKDLLRSIGEIFDKRP